MVFGHAVFKKYSTLYLEKLEGVESALSRKSNPIVVFVAFASTVLSFSLKFTELNVHNIFIKVD